MIRDFKATKYWMGRNSGGGVGAGGGGGGGGGGGRIHAPQVYLHNYPAISSCVMGYNGD